MNITTEDFCHYKMMCSLCWLCADNDIQITHNMLSQYMSVMGSIKSPIEKMMFAALCNVSTGYGYVTPIDTLNFGINGLIVPQYEIGNYFADFVVLLRDGENAFSKVVIECDGHDFHEKTKQQAAHDKKRDRFMKSVGFEVYRFTGSEIYNRYDDVWFEVDCILSKISEKYVDEVKSRG